MTLAGIPRDRLLAAAAMPENRASADLLRRLAGEASPEPLRDSRSREGDEGVRQVENVSQRGSSEAGGVRTRRGRMNATERRFAAEVLDPMVACGEIIRYEFEGLTFFAHGAESRCTPDFVGWTTEGVPVPFEVKAHVVHEATVLRMKLHAAARPWLRWRIYARRDGGWKVWFDSGERRP